MGWENNQIQGGGGKIRQGAIGNEGVARTQVGEGGGIGQVCVGAVVCRLESKGTRVMNWQAR